MDVNEHKGAVMVVIVW